MDRRYSSTAPERPLVLLIDTDQDTLALTALALFGMGFEVIAAQKPDEAFARAWANHPDVIVTETRLARGEAWDLIGRLRAAPRTREIPVVVLTGDAQAVTRDRARGAGCSALVVKPCAPDQLAMMLRGIISAAFAPVPTDRQRPSLA